MVVLTRRAALFTLSLSLSAVAGCKPKRAEPTLLWSIPAYSLTDQDGRPFGSAQLRGAPYVANFVFTRCTASCPRLTAKMVSLAARLRGQRIRFLSMSVDPAFDTPARLRAYGANYHADFSRWSFVTGEHDAILRAIDRGFRVSSGMPEVPTADFDPMRMAHSNYFALVDAQGFMRGAYSAEDEEAFERLALDAQTLVR